MCKNMSVNESGICNGKKGCSKYTLEKISYKSSSICIKICHIHKDFLLEKEGVEWDAEPKSNKGEDFSCPF